MTSARRYPDAESTFNEADAAVQAGREIHAACQPLTRNCPAAAYLRDQRGLPEEAFLEEPAFRYVPRGGLPGWPPHAHGLVALLTNNNGEVTGLQVTGVDTAGKPVANRRNHDKRLTYSLVDKGQRDGLLRLEGTGNLALMCEGYGEKALALRAAGRTNPIYGWGGLNILGYAVPPEPTVVVFPDAVLHSNVVGIDGTSPLDQHRVAYQRGVDRLILAGKDVLLAPPPSCGCCKDLARTSQAGRWAGRHACRAGAMRRWSAGRDERNGGLTESAALRAKLKGEISVLVGSGVLRTRGHVAPGWLTPCSISRRGQQTARFR